MKNVLLVGAGAMGKTHLDAYRNIEEAAVVGVVEKKKEQAKSLGYRENEIFHSIEQAIKQHNIDVIDICVPTPYHIEIIKKSAEYVKYIICEKPLARNFESAQNIFNYCQEKGIKLYVGHVVRFFKEYQKAKKLLQSNVIGDVGVVHMSRVGPFPNASYDWYSNFKYSGGLVTDLIIHDFDFLRWCFGEVKRVFAKGLRGQGFISKDYALVTLKFENGVIAHVEGSWAHDNFHTSFEFAGKKGILEYDSSENNSVQISDNNKKFSNPGVSIPKTALKKSPYQNELIHFLHCIQEDVTPIVNAEDAVKAIEISDAVNLSIDTKKVVYL